MRRDLASLLPVRQSDILQAFVDVEWVILAVSPYRSSCLAATFLEEVAIFFNALIIDIPRFIDSNDVSKPGADTEDPD